VEALLEPRRFSGDPNRGRPEPLADAGVAASISESRASIPLM
jgi:hypothetical protein